MQHKNLLLIGGLPNKTKKLGYGGATVLMQNFVDFLSEKSIKFKFVQTNKYFNKDGKPNGLLNKIYFILRFLFLLPWCDVVMFNFSDHATVSMYPKLVSVAKMLHKKVVFRKFGGSLEKYLTDKNEAIKENTFRAIDKADLVLLETNDSINNISKFAPNPQIVKFPNVRNKTDLRCKKEYNKKFVFISHILDEKGVGDILSVAKNLPKDYQITFYGPIKEEKYFDFDWSSFNVRYGGLLNSEEVLKCLSESNVLLLLTSYREGQPGIIIEAMSVGVPCISTNVGGIPELVENGHNGILIEPGDLNALEDAMLLISQDSYEAMRKNAFEIFTENFEAERTNNRILLEINKLF